MKNLITLLSLIFIFIFGCISSSETTFAFSKGSSDQFIQNEKSTIETIFDNFDNANFQNYDLSSERHILSQKTGKNPSQIIQGNNETGINTPEAYPIDYTYSKQIKHGYNGHLRHEKNIKHPSNPRAP